MEKKTKIEVKMEKIKICPDCKTELKKEPIVKIISHKKIKSDGVGYFCPNRSCNFEGIL